MADRVEEVILEKFAALASNPAIGHWRADLTAADVQFFPVYSYQIVYRRTTKPLQILAGFTAREMCYRFWRSGFKG